MVGTQDGQEKIKKTKKPNVKIWGLQTDWSKGDTSETTEEALSLRNNEIEEVLQNEAS
jgi:hypothetical protein